MQIGLDLDNTIINYEAVFAPVAREIKLIPESVSVSSKTEVKEWLRTQVGDEAWMKLQGQVYGKYIHSATIYEDCEAFIRSVTEQGANITIISHKTKTGHFDEAMINLHDAARNFLINNQFFQKSGLNLDSRQVYFCETREEKISKIREIGCDVFIDDLPEVLMHANFPNRTKRLWFVNDRQIQEDCPLPPYRTWRELLDIVSDLL